MAVNNSLYILRIFEEYSDKHHPLSKNDIKDLMKNEFDIDIEDKQFYRKIKELLDADYNIEKTRGKYAKYYLDKTDLSSYELLYIYTLIKANKTISKNETERLLHELNKVIPVTLIKETDHQEFLEDIVVEKDIIDNVGKFELIVRCIEDKLRIRYKECKNYHTNNPSFSVNKYIIPSRVILKDYSLYVIGCAENKEDIELKLENMFNVEISKI